MRDREERAHAGERARTEARRRLASPIPAPPEFHSQQPQRRALHITTTYIASPNRPLRHTCEQARCATCRPFEDRQQLVRSTVRASETVGVTLDYGVETVTVTATGNS